MRILLTEDEQDMSRVLAAIFKHEGYDIDVAANGQEAVNLAEANSYDCMIMDVMMPVKDGLTALAEIRASGDTTPVIMLTAKAEVDDRIQGLDTGADDYIAKPFGMMELVSRIKAVLRRVGEKTEAPLSQIDGLTVDQQRHLVSVDGEPVALTLKEFALLCELLSANGTVLSRDVLLNRVWGYDYTGESRTVDVHVGTLRQKLGRIGEHIETVRGVGYRIQ